MQLTKERAAVGHGILLIALFSFAACYISQWEWIRALSLSPLIVGIVLGMLYANSLRNHLPDTWVPGIKFCTKQVLRWGIILYGFRLTFQQVVAIGLPATIMDTIIVVGTIGVGLLAGWLLRLDTDTTLMVSTGSAICGAAAVLGAEPVVKCQPATTAIAVSTVVIFGTLSMFLYPVMYRTGMLDMDARQMAVYTGSTLHEVAHVVGGGNAMDPDGTVGIAQAATITKMIRVMMLAPLLVIMGFVLGWVRRRRKSGNDGAASRPGRIAIPWFAFGFLAVIGINSLLQGMCDSGIIAPAHLTAFTQGVSDLDNFMLTMAMTALGTETGLEKFKQAGAKPFYLAGIIYLWLLFGGYFLTRAIVA